MASKRGNRGNEETETEREQQYQNEETDLDPGRRDTEAAISDASARSSRRRTAERAQETEREQQYQNEETDLDPGRRDTEAAISDASARSSRRRTAERAQRRAQRADKGRRSEEDYSDTSRRSGRNGSTRAKDRYHSRRVSKSDLILAFEQYAELKHILEEEWEEYFPHTLKEAARKWYYHYPASNLQSYKKLKKAFFLKYTDDRGDEDILCELNRIKQGKLSVKKYVLKIKELTRMLNESPSEKRMRAWFLSGFNSKKLREQEVPVPTKKFTELVHKALKLEKLAKKEKHRHKASSSDSSTSESSEAEKTSINASELQEEE
ncbi:hypothetical protein L7F22_016348 [Adiantum nelumboides]|nr:hypothetical protein [Adiantum nelumboides]